VAARHDAGAGPAVALLLSRAFIDYSTSGLENPLTNPIMLLFYAEYLGPRRVARLATFASLLMLNRFDAGLLVLPALATAAWGANVGDWSRPAESKVEINHGRGRQRVQTAGERRHRGRENPGDDQAAHDRVQRVRDEVRHDLIGCGQRGGEGRMDGVVRGETDSSEPEHAHDWKRHDSVET
jgi:hypothetical protein